MILTDFQCLECGVTERFLPEDLERNPNPICPKCAKAVEAEFEKNKFAVDFQKCDIKMVDLTPFQKFFPNGQLKTRKEILEMDAHSFMKYVDAIGMIQPSVLSLHIVCKADKLSDDIAKKYNKIMNILKDIK